MAANQRWKTAERKISTALQYAAGKVKDAVLKKLVTTTGRVGHITELGFDILVGNPEDGTALCGEVKRRSLPKWLVDALVQVYRLGLDYNRHPVLVFELSDDVETKFVETSKGKKRLQRDWALVSFDYFEELLVERRKYALLLRYLEERPHVNWTEFTGWCLDQEEEF